MKSDRYSLSMVLAISVFCSLVTAQQATVSLSSAEVPRLVNFSGKATDAQGKALSGIAGVTFAIYKDQYEGAPLWLETQNVQADSKGNYTVQLGATTSDGLPLELFSSGAARWLGVRVNGGEEQPRVLLLSVPYALKAADAQTLAGLPPSAFVLAVPPSNTAGLSSQSSAPPAASSLNGSLTLGGSGLQNYLPLWTDNSGTLGNSVFYQLGTGSSAKIGLNLKNPLATLDVNGGTLIRGTLEPVTKGVATASKGFNSNPLDLEASAFSSSNQKAVMQHFEWQAEPTGNNTSTTGATLNLLFGQDSAIPAETGLKLSNKGIFTFAPGQTFPGGSGTVTSVGLSAPVSDFTVSGSPITIAGTLGLNWTVAPTNATTPNAIVKRDAKGGFSAGPISATNILTPNTNTITGTDTSNSGGSAGVYGTSTSGTGVSGTSTSSVGVSGFGGSYGVAGTSPNGTGVSGYGSYGVYGSGTYYGVLGSGSYGVYGDGIQVGVYGQAPGLTGVFGLGFYGVYGQSDPNYGGYGVWGESYDLGGVNGVSHTSYGSGVSALEDGGGDAVYAVVTQGGYAGYFAGDVGVAGVFTATTKNFKIDHPLDPANRYLVHSTVESSEMMNLYTGNVTTDGHGDATVRLPEWFEALNTDFRYQLTVIGEFAQAIVSRKMENHEFQIKTSAPNVEVSWQVTCVRQDAFAKAHPLVVEQDKPEKERGFYLHPDLFGASEEKTIGWARHPGMMRVLKEKKAPAPVPMPHRAR